MPEGFCKLSRECSFCNEAIHLCVVPCVVAGGHQDQPEAKMAFSHICDAGINYS